MYFLIDPGVNCTLKLLQLGFKFPVWSDLIQLDPKNHQDTDLMAMQKFPFSILTNGLLACCMSLMATMVFAAESESNASATWWNFVISLIVLAALLASAALPLAALRQWSGGWRIAALLPLALLVLWVAVIALSRMTDSNSHRLWPFEIFSWAMLNMIYMVAVMTYKRKIDKALGLHSDENQAQEPDSASDQA